MEGLIKVYAHTELCPILTALAEGDGQCVGQAESLCQAKKVPLDLQTPGPLGELLGGGGDMIIGSHGGDSGKRDVHEF